jgi:hypothetical protein
MFAYNTWNKKSARKGNVNKKTFMHEFFIWLWSRSFIPILWIMQMNDNFHVEWDIRNETQTNHVASLISSHRTIGKYAVNSSTCRLYGTDLFLWCSLLSFGGREKLRHDFALKLHESSDVPVDDRAVPVSFVVTISGILVWSCNEFLLIFMRLRYGIYSAFYCFHIRALTVFVLLVWRKTFIDSRYAVINIALTLNDASSTLFIHFMFWEHSWSLSLTALLITAIFIYSPSD